MELSDSDCHVESRAGAGRRQCDGVQTQRNHALGRAQAGGNLHRSRLAGWCVQRGAGRLPCGCGAERAPRYCQNLLHRRRGHRQKSDGASRRIQPERCHHGIGRQIAADYLRRCRHQFGCRHRHDGQFLQRRPSVHQRHARVCAGQNERSFRGRDFRARGAHPHWQPA